MPPRGHRAGELFEEMLNATLAAAQMVEKAWPHGSPTLSRTPRNGSIGMVFCLVSCRYGAPSFT
jgi:hypothetical protein